MSPAKTKGIFLGIVLGVLVGAGLLYVRGGREVEEVASELPEVEPPPADSMATAEIALPDSVPAYSVLGVAEELGSPTRGDVIVPALTRETPAAVREAVLRRIMQLEGLDEAALFCSEDALRAAYSEVFQSEHPGALQTCGLGQVGSDGVFNSWDALYR
jgi:hypothetical protein